MVDIGSFNLATFSHRIDEVFKLDAGNGMTLELRLAEAIALSEGGRGSEAREPFSLTFLGPAPPVLPQKIYRLEHPEIGSFEIFLVPIGPGEAGMRYEAIFT